MPPVPIISSGINLGKPPWIKINSQGIQKRVDTFGQKLYCSPTIRRGVEQLAARRAHNPEAVGSSPTPAIRKFRFQIETFFI